MIGHEFCLNLTSQEVYAYAILLARWLSYSLWFSIIDANLGVLQDPAI
jgi:hypothetical protein